MQKMIRHKLINYCIATVWIANGLFCKVLNLVPRHQEIVARILGNDHARLLTVLIGVSEIAMAIWILIGLRTRLNGVTQIIVIATMNTLEFLLAPDLIVVGEIKCVLCFPIHTFNLLQRVSA